MATKKRLSIIYELENFQVDVLFRFGVLSNLLAWRWKTTPPSPALIGLKLEYAKFGVSDLSFSKVIEENPLGVGSTPPPLGKRRVKPQVTQILSKGLSGL